MQRSYRVPPAFHLIFFGVCCCVSVITKENTVSPTLPTSWCSLDDPFGYMMFHPLSLYTLTTWACFARSLAVLPPDQFCCGVLLMETIVSGVEQDCESTTRGCCSMVDCCIDVKASISIVECCIDVKASIRHLYWQGTGFIFPPTPQ